MLFSKTGSFISPFIRKSGKFYSLILMVLCYSMITCQNYVLLWLVCKFFKRHWICFLFRYLSNHWSMFTKLPEKWERKNLQHDTCSSSLFKNRRRVQLGKTSIPWADDRLESLFWNISKLLTDACVIWYWTVVQYHIYKAYSVFRWIFVFDIAIYYNLTFHRCNMMRSAIKQIIKSDAKWNCLHSST